MTGKMVKISFFLLLVVVGLAMIGPCLVQDQTTGVAGGAVENIKKSLDNTNDAIEESPVGNFFEAIDASTD